MMLLWWIGAAALLLIIVAWLIWKIVVVPTLTVATDKAGYDRSEKVHISGNLSDATGPLSGRAVKPAIEPPIGDAYTLPDLTTDENGDYSTDPDWEVPDDAVAGTYTLTVAALGVLASKTFT